MRPPEPEPRVGVTGPDRGGTPAWLFTRLALRRAGACAVRITPSRRVDPRTLDGLVVGGGADVTVPLPSVASVPPPSRTRGKVRRAVDLLLSPLVLLVRYVGSTRRHGVDPSRDALELALLDHARARALPVLGICRGAQLMSLAEGGTIVRNLRSLYAERPDIYTVLPRREVTIAEDARLGRILRSRSILVNSLHFQAVDMPGEAMRVVAREPSGVAQAVEHRERDFWIGVQWHPEYLPQDERQQRLFEALVDTARAHRASGSPERPSAAELS